MSYTVSYKDMPEADAFAQAISDCKDYVGHDKFDDICKTLRECLDHKGGFILACSFVGIKGFPAHCLYKHLGGKE